MLFLQFFLTVYLMVGIVLSLVGLGFYVPDKSFNTFRRGMMYLALFVWGVIVNPARMMYWMATD